MDLTVDQSKLDRSLAHFNQTMTEYARTLNLAPKDVVKRQAGILARMLINITPPKDVSKTRQNIADNVNEKFTSMREWHTGMGRHTNTVINGRKAYKGDVNWYAFFPNQVFGIAEDKNCVNDDLDYLLRQHYRYKLSGSGNGRLNVGTRGKQTFWLWQRLLTTEKQVLELIKHLQARVGRLKAAWMVSWEDAGRPGGPPPRYVSDHVTKSRAGKYGYSKNELGIPGHPTFSIANRAKGAEEIKRTLDWFLGRALRMRALAMKNDMQFAIQNPDKWKEREANAGLRMAVNNL